MLDAPAANACIIEVALNGVTTRRRNELVPVAPDELAAEAISCIDAGASIVHTHAHNLGASTEELTAAYRDCYSVVRAERPGAILYPTVGFGADVTTKFAHVQALVAEGLIDATFLDPGSVNLGGTGVDGLPPAMDFVYTNTFNEIRYAMDLADQLGLGPSIAIFEPGFLQVVLAYHEAEALPAGTLVKFYFAAGGYLTKGRALWGAPPIHEALDLYLAMLGDAPIPWAVAVVGGSLCDSVIFDDALLRGGHVRVGIEDDQDGPTNLEQVKAVAERIAGGGRVVASPSEARAILRLPTPLTPH